MHSTACLDDVLDLQHATNTAGMIWSRLRVPAVLNLGSIAETAQATSSNKPAWVLHQECQEDARMMPLLDWLKADIFLERPGCHDASDI